MMNSFQVHRRLLMVLVGCILLVTTAGIASAAVAGDFTSSYTGFGSGDSSAAPGNEISVQGQMEVTGDPAVDPRIVIQGGQWSVLDTSSVQVFVEGDRSIDFDQTTRDGDVILTTNEIPAETTIRVEYLTYYTGGADSSSITASDVQFSYDLPSGDQAEETFTTETTLENSPEKFVEEANSNSQLSFVQEILSYIGGGGIVLLIIAIVLLALRDGGPPGSGGGVGPN